MPAQKMRLATYWEGVITYSTRSMPMDSLDRMRVLKLYMNASIEVVLNEALELGLRELEERHIHKKKELKG